jgi:tRNA-Thr(GGU) m(6)t(6)A37 methyltransferase TsaA
MKFDAVPLHQIAVCHTDTPDRLVAKNRKDMITTIKVFTKYQEGLIGIEAYSHLMVIFWMDRVADLPLITHPRGDTTLDKVGAFALRGRNHPNSLGLAVVRLLSTEINEITVKGLDAFDGTPVLDIKPYDDYDVVQNPKVPEWFKQKSRTRNKNMV